MQTKYARALCLLGMFFLLLACNFPTGDSNLPGTGTDQPVATQATAAVSSTPTSAPATQAPVPAVKTKEPVSAGCASGWFFTFDDDYRDLGAFCPGPARAADAVGQDFEGGRVYYYAPDPAYTTDLRGTIYVIYNDGEWITFPDNWDTTQPSSDPNLVPPEGRYQPVERIGKVWRDNADVRNRLGWAYEVQSSFPGRYQHYSEESAPTGDMHFSFIDHGKWGVVLLLNSVDMGPNTWTVVGHY
ncbi:MAG: hypothetical protein JXA21_29220 [Anaerolineae bacterium]|nr:hypothetical protein [Anaerolineae bacterium]